MASCPALVGRQLAGSHRTGCRTRAEPGGPAPGGPVAAPAGSFGCQPPQLRGSSGCQLTRHPLLRQTGDPRHLGQRFHGDLGSAAQLAHCRRQLCRQRGMQGGGDVVGDTGGVRRPVLRRPSAGGRAFWCSSTSTSSHAWSIPCQPDGTGTGRAPSARCQLALRGGATAPARSPSRPGPGMGSRWSRTTAAAWWWSSRSRAGVQGSKPGPASRMPARVARTQVWPIMRRRTAQPAASQTMASTETALEVRVTALALRTPRGLIVGTDQGAVALTPAPA
jgi:hypothetical protein